MNFVSLAFILLLVATIILFYSFPARWRKPLLLGVSYIFYATWNVPFIALILLSTTVDYWMSQIIANHAKLRVRQSALVFGLVVNLGILIYFKYTNFLIGTCNGWLHWMGYHVEFPAAMNILLPLGISFYTFEAISYMVDVYRGKEPARNWLDYNFYIMYFPHLISGPIIRFCELMPQYKAPLALPSLSRIAKGVELLLLGYIFKIFVADSVAGMADSVFLRPAEAGVLVTWLGALAFTVQIYFDFMGYTHIARGVSLLFNIELPLNFNHPYLASNISEFWERWHISLSRWIRDYLFIPLGGSRGSLGRVVFNLMLTMLICGAWHGAGWTFIVWGGYHGFLLAAYHLFKHWKKTAKLHMPSGVGFQMGSVLLTFFLVVLGWVLFRAPDLGTAGNIFAKLFNFPGLWTEVVSLDYIPEFIGLLGMLALCFTGPWVIRWIAALYQPLPFYVKVQLACILAFVFWLFTAEGTVPFIYFQF